jgi:hypothetical protein
MKKLFILALSGVATHFSFGQYIGLFTAIANNSLQSIYLGLITKPTSISPVLANFNSHSHGKYHKNMIFFRCSFVILFICISNSTFTQKNNTYSSITTTYNQLFYNFPTYYKAKFNSGLSILFVENTNKFRFSVGFDYSSKKYFIPELLESNPLYFEQFSIPNFGIPLSISYFFMNKSKNQFGLSIVQMFNKSMNYKFLLYNENFKILEKGSMQSKIILSSGIGFYYRYNIKKNMSFVINPILSFNNNSKTQFLNTNSITFNIPTSKPTIFINIGVEYLFRKSFVSQYLSQNIPPSL